MSSNDDAADKKTVANQMGEVVLKAWTDEDFRQRLLADPATVLQQNGVPVPPGVAVKVVEDTDQVNHFVLPPKPADLEISDFRSDDATWCWSANAICSF
jgi:nitrile hydratase alpha subunit